MRDDIKMLINQSVIEIIQKCANDNKIVSLAKRHNKKLHFIPIKYRILGGILQSMNIQFDNFIEILMKNLIANEDRYEIIEQYSGKKSNKFSLLSKNEELIDSYITKCQTDGNIELETDFVLLQKEIFKNNKEGNGEIIYFTHDIDLLFRNKQTGVVYYLEIKYNDECLRKLSESDDTIKSFDNLYNKTML